MKSDTRLLLRRRLTEALAIIASILVAFAIDAWWDGEQAQRRAGAQVEALRSEFQTINLELGRAADELETALDATRRLAARVSPRPVWLPADSMGMLLLQSLTVNSVEMPSGALSALLASGELSQLGDPALQRSLAGWPSSASLIGAKFAYVVNDRDTHVLPLLRRLIAIETAVAAALPNEALWPARDQFPYDPMPLLESRELKNLLMARTITIMIAQGAVDAGRSLSDSIQEGLREWR